MSLALTFAVFLTWVVIALALSAIGVWFLNRLVGGMDATWEYAFCGIWTGFALTIAGLMLWHLFLPVNAEALAVFTTAAILALVVERRWFAAALRTPFSRPFAAIAAVFAIWTANHAIAPGGYDDYAYEFQAIRWFGDYPLVPGLANLSGRIGFNNSHHLFAALLSVGPWRGAVNHIFNGLFVVLVCLFVLDAIRNLTKGTRASLERALFPSLLLCPCAGLVLFGPIGSMLSTLKADVFVCVATVLLACLFLRWAAAAPGAPARRVLTVTTLAVACVIPTIKLNGLIFSGIVIAAVILSSFRRRAADAMDRRAIAGSLVLGFMLLACVPVRGVILSGYPFYPLTVFGFNVEWRVPAPLVELERAIITSFARIPMTHETAPDRVAWTREVETERAALLDLRSPFNPHTLLDEPWIWKWAQSTAVTDRIDILMPLILALASIVLLFSTRRRKPAAASGAPPQWAYATISFAAAATLVGWFIEAPAGRFVIADVWILFASILSAAIQKTGGQWKWSSLLWALAASVAPAAVFLFGYLRIHGEPGSHILALLLFTALWLTLFALFASTKPRILAALCLLPAFFQYGEYLLTGGYTAAKSILRANAFPHQPSATIVRQTCSGLRVYVIDFPVFETPLPNTREFSPFLQLRTSNMRDGFLLRECGASR